MQRSLAEDIRETDTRDDCSEDTEGNEGADTEALGRLSALDEDNRNSDGDEGNVDHNVRQALNEGLLVALDALARRRRDLVVAAEGGAFEEDGDHDSEVGAADEEPGGVDGVFGPLDVRNETAVEEEDDNRLGPPEGCLEDAVEEGEDGAFFDVRELLLAKGVALCCVVDGVGCRVEGQREVSGDETADEDAEGKDRDEEAGVEGLGLELAGQQTDSQEDDGKGNADVVGSLRLVVGDGREHDGPGEC